MKLKRVITEFVAVSAFSLSLCPGCASKQVSLTLDYRPTKAGLLSELNPAVLSLRVVDHRPLEERNGIGIQRHVLSGTEHAVVTSRTPVPQVVYNALKAELERSGHRVLESGQGVGATTIDVALTQFLIDSKMADADIELLGTIRAEVMTPAGTADMPSISLFTVESANVHRVRMNVAVRVLTRGLVPAIRSHVSRSDLQKTMNGALAEFVRRFCLEPNLRQALVRAAQETGTRSSASPATKSQ